MLPFKNKNPSDTLPLAFGFCAEMYIPILLNKMCSPPSASVKSMHFLNTWDFQPQPTFSVPSMSSTYDSSSIQPQFDRKHFWQKHQNMLVLVDIFFKTRFLPVNILEAMDFKILLFRTIPSLIRFCSMCFTDLILNFSLLHVNSS